MPLTPTGEIVTRAADSGVGISSFNVIQLEHAEVIATGADAARAPVILQISENCVQYHGGLGAIGSAVLALAAADVPVSVHLDHATRPELVDEAIAVGTSHQMLTRDAALDFDLIAALHAAVPVPLVLHGSSGVADADMTTAVERGMTKINIATHLNKAFTDAVRAHVAADPHVADTRKDLGDWREAVAREVTRLLGVLRSAGSAAVA